MPLVSAPSRSYLPGQLGTNLLRAALLDGEPAARAWAAARPEFLVPARQRAPQVRWMTPLLAQNLERQGIHDELLVEMLAERELTAERNGRLFEHVAQLVLALESAGIQVMLLKGAALVAGNATASSVRPMSDVDILVPQSTARRAWQITVDAGWTPRHEVTDWFVQVKHAAHLADEDGCQLDLHWYVFEDSCAPGIDAGIWLRSVPAQIGTIAVRRPSAADALLHACVHGARWTRTPGIRWATDAYQVMTTRDVDWSVAISEARRRAFVVRFRSTLRYLRRTLAAPVPVEVERELGATGAGFVERLEHAALAHEQKRLGALPSYFFAFHRAHRHELPEALLDFPAYLAAAWGVDTPADLARAAIARAQSRLRGAQEVP